MTVDVYIALGIMALTLVVFVGGSLWQRSVERRHWNDGLCSDCSTFWQYKALDSQNGRGYHCSCDDGHWCWISYGVDR